MSAAFTPGPWAYRSREYDDWGIVRAGDAVICQARDPHIWDETQLAEHRRNKTDPWAANANLIAAAPELYEACEALMRLSATSKAHCGVAVKLAHAALAKASGEQP